MSEFKASLVYKMSFRTGLLHKETSQKTKIDVWDCGGHSHSNHQNQKSPEWYNLERFYPRSCPISLPCLHTRLQMPGLSIFPCLCLLSIKSGAQL